VSVVHLPAGLPHYAHADVVVPINGVGPFDVVHLCGQAEHAFWHAEEHLTLEAGELCLEHLHRLAIVEQHVPVDKAEKPEHLFRRRTLAAPLLGVQGQLEFARASSRGVTFALSTPARGARGSTG
jgi:hypothetical protein